MGPHVVGLRLRRPVAAIEPFLTRTVLGPCGVNSLTFRAFVLDLVSVPLGDPDFQRAGAEFTFPAATANTVRGEITKPQSTVALTEIRVFGPRYPKAESQDDDQKLNRLAVKQDGRASAPFCVATWLTSGARWISSAYLNTESSSRSR